MHTGNIEAPVGLPGSRVVRVIFVPCLLAFSGIGFWLYQPATALFRDWRLPLDFGTALLLMTATLTWLVEQAYPRFTTQYPAKLRRIGGELPRDVFYLLVVTQISAWLIRQVAAVTEPALAPLQQNLWPTQAPLPLKVALVFFVSEFFSYWAHRAAHRFRLLWRFHSTHHFSIELTALKAVKMHPLDNLLFYFARNIPLILIGAGSDEVIVVMYFSATLSLLAHANVDCADGIWSLVLNLPAYHRVHHSANLATSLANFGCHTIVFDRLFNTFSRPHPERIEVGVDPVFSRSIVQELIGPFFRVP